MCFMPRVTSSMALTGERLLFPHGQYIFGRAQGCHILFPMSSAVSRQHCLLSVTEQGAVVRDLGSRNSTVVNSERVPGERPLGHGDRLYLVGQLTSIDKWRETALLEVQATFWLPAKEFHHD